MSALAAIKATAPSVEKLSAPKRPFVPSAVTADLMALPRPGTTWLFRSLVGLVALFVLWAAFANLQEVTTGRGRVIPASKLQVVQSLEGGIVREILSREGQLVREGDVLLRIDPTLAGSTLGEARERLIGLRAMVARLEAEVEGKPLVLPPELALLRPDLVQTQIQQHDGRKRELEGALAALELVVQQKRQEIREAEARQQTLGRSVLLAREEVTMLRGLERTRAAARAEVLTSESKLNELEGQLTAINLALPRLHAAVAEAENRRTERLEAFRGDALQKLSTARVELAALGEQSRSSEDKVARTTVKAPVTGLVKLVSVTTPGQVVQPGHNLVEIVPVNDTLLIEAQVRPQDIAFIRPQQDTIVRLTAYDYAVYGTLKGQVEHIGVDSVTTDKGESYYLIRVRTDVAHLDAGGRRHPIIPGMVAEVDVITGSKSVLGYLTKPFTRMRTTALRER
jgi:membrane fusion protein, adhesin transport system